MQLKPCPSYLQYTVCTSIHLSRCHPPSIPPPATERHQSILPIATVKFTTAYSHPFLFSFVTFPHLDWSPAYLIFLIYLEPNQSSLFHPRLNVSIILCVPPNRDLYVMYSGVYNHTTCMSLVPSLRHSICCNGLQRAGSSCQPLF